MNHKWHFLTNSELTWKSIIEIFQFWHRGIRILVDTFEPIGFENSPHYHSTTAENEPDAVFEILFKSRDSPTLVFKI